MNTLKPFESRSGQIGLLILAALIGGFLGEPVKNFINRAHVKIDVVSIESTTPPKVSRRMNLTSSTQQRLALEIAGDDWVTAVRSNSITYGDVIRRLEKLKQFHEAFPALSQRPAWGSDPKTDLTAFYQLHREYIRTILEYVQNLRGVGGEDQRMSASFLKLDRDSTWFGMLSRQGDPLRNAGDIVRFAGKFQAEIREKTQPLFEALTKAEREDVIEPIPSFVVTLDAINHGNIATSIGTIGSLQVQSPSGDYIVVLTLMGDPDKVAVLAPGQRQRLRLSTELKLILDERASLPDIANRLKTIQDKQRKRIEVLAPLYKSGVHDCRITLRYGESQDAETSGKFGESQALNQLESVLDRPK